MPKLVIKLLIIHVGNDYSHCRSEITSHRFPNISLRLMSRLTT